LTHCNNKTRSIKNHASKEVYPAQLRVTDIYETDDTLQAAASTAEHTPPMILPEAESEYDDDLDDHLDDDIGGEKDSDT